MARSMKPVRLGDAIEVSASGDDARPLRLKADQVVMDLSVGDAAAIGLALVASARRMAAGRGKAVGVKCSFCGCAHDESEVMLQSPHGVFICDRCVDSSVALVAKEKASGGRK